MGRFVTFVFAALLLAACSEEESGQTPGPVTDAADASQDAAGDTGNAIDVSLEDLAMPGDASSATPPPPSTSVSGDLDDLAITDAALAYEGGPREAVGRAVAAMSEAMFGVPDDQRAAVFEAAAGE